MDGVLVDSAGVHSHAWTALFRSEGVDFEPEDYRVRAEGKPRDVVIRAVLGDRPDHAVLMARKAALVVEHLSQSPVPRVQGVADVLERARSAGLRLAVGSNSRMTREFLVSAALDQSFDAIVDRNDVARGKPAPDVFEEASRRLGLDPVSCVVIEDTAPGVAAGLAAGCRVVLLDRAGHGDSSGADRVVQHLDELTFDHPGWAGRR